MVNQSRRKVLKMLSAVPLISGTAADLFACSDEPTASDNGQHREAERSEMSARAPIAPGKTPWEGRRVERSLIDSLSFASLRRDGLLIDFGSTDSFKYTFGGWRSGWGKHFEKDGVAYTHATSTASRLYFHWDGQQDLVVRFRIRRMASQSFSLYVNSKRVKDVALTSSDWKTYESRIPANLVREGVNHLLLRWGSTRRVAGEDVAAAVDYIQFAADQGETQRAGALPRQASLIGEVDGSPALVLVPGTTLSYWMQPPAHGEPMLGFTATAMSVGKEGSATNDSESTEPPTNDTGHVADSVKLVVTARVDGEEPTKLLATKVHERPKSLGVPLTRFGNEAIRLDIAVTGLPTGGTVALQAPAIYVTPKRPAVVPRKPARNTIVVMVDTLRADHLSAYNKTRVQTPALQKFAYNGVVFERYSAVEDWTKPSCATMLTGLYPGTHRTQSDSDRLPASVRMVPQEMQARNVATGGFIANGYVSGKFGFEKGWDRYTNYIRENKRTEAEHVFADAYQWIAKQNASGQRFYAYVHTIDPHVPYDPPGEFLRLYEQEPYAGSIKPRSTAFLLEDIKRKKFVPTAADKRHIRALYDGEISYHDKWFGDFMAKLDQLGVLEDTLVIVVSDHGEEFWEHGNVGHGHQIHQELIHVPFIMGWKGGLPGGTRVADNYDHCSLVPTLFDAMGLEPPAYLESNSVLDVARGQGAPAPAAGFSTHQGEREAVWCGRYKLLQRGPINTSLFDIDSDPGCQKNLKQSHPIALTTLRAVLGQFHGAADKAQWRSRELGTGATATVAAEKVEMDTETREQLKALGYFE